MIAARERRAFERFVQAHGDRLVRTAYLLTGDRGHAEDLAQTALLRTARRWRTAREAPEAYARTVVVNLAKDRWRSESRRSAEAPLLDLELAGRRHRPAARPRPAAPGRRRAAGGTAGRAGAAVLRGPQRSRRPPRTLGCTTGTVKSQTSRALAGLRRALTTHHETETADAHR